MDHIHTDSPANKEADLVNLSNAIQTNDLPKILEYKAFCRSDILLPHSNNQVRMPAIALAIQTVCSEVKSPYYNYANDNEVIKFLITQCDVDPNAPFKIYGETKPSWIVRRSFTYTPTEEAVNPENFEEHIPLSLLLSYYINHGAVSELVILDCMQQLIQSGAKPSSKCYMIDCVLATQEGKKSSLLMASLQSRLKWTSSTVDFFRFFLENGATFSEDEKAPLAQYSTHKQRDREHVLDLFYKYYKKGQITKEQIFDPSMFGGDLHDAMYIWCRYAPSNSEDGHALDVFLAMGFDPQSGMKGIADSMDNVLGSGSNSYMSHSRDTYIAEFNLLERSLRSAIRNREEVEAKKMKNVNILQSLGKYDVPPEIQQTIFHKSGGSDGELAQAHNALSRHMAAHLIQKLD